MADWDAVGALAEGIKQGFLTYNDVKKTQREEEMDRQDRALKERLLKFNLAEKGYQETPSGSFETTPAKQEEQFYDTATKLAGVQAKGMEFLPEFERFKVFSGKDQSEDPTKALQNQYLREKISALRNKPAPKTNVKPNEWSAAQFGKRMEHADKVFSQLASGGYSRAGLLGAAESKLPEAVRAGPTKQQAQAERNFVNAVLRDESGAAISPTEFESAALQYFPRVGDNEATLRQKAQNRRQAIENFKAEAGSAWQMIPTAQTPGSAPGASKGLLGDIQGAVGEPTPGTVENGFRFKGGDPANPQSWEKVK